MYRIYQIQMGDDLENIAKKLSTTTQELMRLNGITKDVALMPGGFIIIPARADRFTIYTVKKGDSIYSIAREMGVDYELLLNINGLEKDDYIYPDQEIMIPSKDYKFYMTKEGDTIKGIVEDLKIDYNNLLNNNDQIFLQEDQLIIYK